MKKIRSNIFMLLFLIICIIPSAGMLIWGSSEALANEVRAGVPTLKNKDGSFNIDYLSDLSDHLSDSFALRRELVTAWAEIQSDIFSTSAEDSVTVGRNGWLYYTATIDDFTGKGMSEGRLKSAARNLSLMQEYTEEKGATFVFTIAPNKNSLYPENMPHYIKSSRETSNAERIETYFTEFSLNYADLFKAIGTETETLYFSTDSHWNSRGAALGADTLLTAAGKESSFYQGDFVTGEEHTGDLYDMLYPAGSFREKNIQYAPGFTFTTEKSTNGGNALSIVSHCENGSGGLLCWRDSFGISLYPYLSEYFADAHFSRSAVYDLTELENGSADTVIIELVERNLNYLLENMAVYQAPERETPEYDISDIKLIAELNEKNAASGDNLTLITVPVTDEIYEEGTRAYILYGGRCFEAGVLYDDECAKLCIYTSASATDTDAQTAVICERNGTCILYNVG